MANTDKITIEINKEIAKEAFEAGARWALGDEDETLTIEGFDKYWTKIESALADITNDDRCLHLQRVRQQSELFVSFARFVANYKHSYATAYEDMFNEWCSKKKKDSEYDWKTEQKKNFCRNRECPFYDGFSYGCEQRSDAQRCAAREFY